MPTFSLARPVLLRRLTAAPLRPLAFILLAVVAGLMLARLPLLPAVALVGGAAVFLLVVIQPLVGLGLALLFGPLGALESVVLGGTALDSGQVLLLLTLAVWIGRGLSRRRLALPQTALNLPFALLLLVQLLTLPGAIAPTAGLTEMLKWVEMALIVWLIVDVVRDTAVVDLRRAIIWLLVMLLAAGASQALVGIWQFALRGEGPEHFLVLGRFYRAYGTFEQPNPFGGYMNLSALLAWGVLIGILTARARTGLRGMSRSALLFTLFVGATAVLTTLALLFSWSRGAWLGFAAGAAALLFFWPRRWWIGVVVVLLVVALFAVGLWLDVVPTAVTARLAGFAQDLTFGDVRGVDINDANYAVLERLAHWQAALSMAREHLWLGVGIGNYAAAYPAYALINWPDPLGHAHNYYLNVLAETGVLGLLAYLVFWTAVLWQSGRLLAQLAWPHRGIALGLLAAWVSLSVHHLVDKLYVNNIYVHLGVMLGLLQLASCLVAGNRRERRTERTT